MPCKGVIQLEHWLVKANCHIGRCSLGTSETVTDEVCSIIEEFICRVYHCDTKIQTLTSLRWWVYTSKQTLGDKLSHPQRVFCCLQSTVRISKQWYGHKMISADRHLHLLLVMDGTWRMDSSLLYFANCLVLQNPSWNWSNVHVKNRCSARCICRANELPCTEMCGCSGDETLCDNIYPCKDRILTSVILKIMKLMI